ncbi:MAG: hypothetical protein ACYTE6_09690 [Planctomycetota bacterium]|jgi:hypothetical protein
MRFLCLIALALAAAFAMPAAGADASTNIFVLRQTDQGPVIDAVPIAANETKAFRCNEGGHGPLDIIFPPTAGRSASLLTIGDGATIIVRHTGTALQVESRAADGSSREYPPREIEDLVRYDIRVNVNGPEHRAAFVIEQYERVRRDVGPVCNMFAGSLPPPMLAKAIIVETNTYLHSAGPSRRGPAGAGSLALCEGDAAGRHDGRFHRRCRRRDHGDRPRVAPGGDGDRGGING